MKKSIFLLSTIIAIATSCSSPLDKKYSKDTFKNDIQKIVESKTVDSVGMQVLLGVAMADAFGASGKLEGKTYREIIDDAKKKQEEERELAEKAAKDEIERIDRLNNALTVAVFEKGFYEADYEDYITFKLAFENKVDKEIRAFTGTIIFTDLFDKEIKSISITYDQPIAAKTTRKWSAQIDYNKFVDSDQRLASKKLADIKTIWKPEKILFSDGTSLE